MRWDFILHDTNTLADYCSIVMKDTPANGPWVIKADCKDFIPCSKLVMLKKDVQTCDKFCQDDKKGKKCVSSWISETPDSDTYRCQTLSSSPCGKTYSVDTAVVCVCAVKAKCTLFAKCDFRFKEDVNQLNLGDKEFRPSNSDSDKTDWFESGIHDGNTIMGFNIDPRM